MRNMRNSQGRGIHPGDVLLEVYMKPSCPPLTVAELSRTIHVPEQNIADFIDGKRPVTRILAGQLGVFCRTTADYWLGLQRTYDHETGKRSFLRTRRSRTKHISWKVAA